MWHTGWHWPVLLLISRMRLPAWRNGCSSQVFSFFLAQVWPTWLIFMGMTWIFYEEIVPSSLFPTAVRPRPFWYTPWKGCHRLLNWQIQITKVSWVGQSTRGGSTIMVSLTVKKPFWFLTTSLRRKWKIIYFVICIHTSTWVNEKTILCIF